MAEEPKKSAWVGVVHILVRAGVQVLVALLIFSIAEHLLSAIESTKAKRYALEQHCVEQLLHPCNAAGLAPPDKISASRDERSKAAYASLATILKSAATTTDEQKKANLSGAVQIYVTAGLLPRSALELPERLASMEPKAADQVLQTLAGTRPTTDGTKKAKSSSR